MPQIITITGICIIIIFCSMFAAKGVLKEHTPVQILKIKLNGGNYDRNKEPI